ncbi:biliverdin-producing heme oxygenase [Propionibacteriaceae bacterium Y1685]
MADDTTTFSARLRAATRTDHAEAENSPFIVTLLEGSRSLADYTSLIAQYRPIYAALEAAAARLRQHAELTQILDPRLDAFADTEDRAQMMVDEPVSGFGLNRQLFAELLDQSQALPAA